MLRDLLRMGPLFFVLALGGCGNGVGTGGAVVGGDCVVSGECAHDSFCLTGEAYPDGYCVQGCDSDAECPAGSACVEHGGGVCLLSCTSAAECREGYDCLALDVRGGPGTATVCITP